MNNWGESTDPRKHVFEDIAIAAFIIEYWKLNSFEPEKFEFRDLGCGNGLLVHILILEGYKGRELMQEQENLGHYIRLKYRIVFWSKLSSPNFT